MFKTFGLVGMKDKRILATRKIVEKDFFIKRIIAHAKTALQEPKPEPVEAAKKIQVGQIHPIYATATYAPGSFTLKY